MSPRYPSIKPRQMFKVLEAKGFAERRVTGSHHIFRHTVTGQIVPVPVHGNHELKHGTLRSILRLADISIEELEDFLRK